MAIAALLWALFRHFRFLSQTVTFPSSSMASVKLQFPHSDSSLQLCSGASSYFAAVLLRCFPQAPSLAAVSPFLRYITSFAACARRSSSVIDLSPSGRVHLQRLLPLLPFGCGASVGNVAPSTEWVYTNVLITASNSCFAFYTYKCKKL